MPARLKGVSDQLTRRLAIKLVYGKWVSSSKGCVEGDSARRVANGQNEVCTRVPCVPATFRTGRHHEDLISESVSACRFGHGSPKIIWAEIFLSSRYRLPWSLCALEELNAKKKKTAHASLRTSAEAREAYTCRVGVCEVCHANLA